MTPQSRALATLLTRPTAQSDRFAAALIARFGDRLAVTTSPLIAPEFLRPPIPERAYTALILTSETGATSATGFSGLPRRAYCVGDRTAETARSLGFTAVSANGDATALIALIRASGEAGPLLHLRGQDARGDIAATLTAASVPTDQAITYDQRPQALSPAARALLNGSAPVLVPLFSPRSATLLAGQGPFRAPLWVAALSPAVAAAAAPLSPARQVISDTPNVGALLTAISTFIDVPNA